MTFTPSVIHPGKLSCWLAVGLGVLLTGASHGADSDGKYRVSFSFGAAFNISAKFRGHPGDVNLQNPSSQSGAAYFDNGYAGPDVSADPNLTTYWGYDQADQRIISGGNVIGMNYERTTAVSDTASPTMDADPSPSGEVVVRRRIAGSSWPAFGVEFGASYTELEMDDNSPYSAHGQRTGYTFGLPGPVDAELFPPAGYQGPFNGLGPVLNLKPTASPTTTVPRSVTVSGSRRINAEVFGIRLGPFLEFPISERLTASISGGVVVALINDRVKWQESVSINTATSSGYWTGQTSVSQNHWGTAYGYYFGADVIYALDQHWLVVGGCKLQGLGTYEHNIGQGEMEMDLSQSIFVSLGLGWSF
jgi:hypothetical protein